MGAYQKFLIYPVLFNICLKKIMKKSLRNHHAYINIGGRPISNVRFADEIDLIGGTSSKLEDLTNRPCKAYGMEVSTGQSKFMMNITNNTSITMNGKIAG